MIARLAVEGGSVARRPEVFARRQGQAWFQECGAAGLFEMVDLTSEGGLSDVEVFGGPG